MSDIVKVVEEEFDDEGNLVRRITTEYAPEKKVTNVPWSPGLTVGDVWPYPLTTGQIVSNPDKYTSWNEYDQHVRPAHVRWN